MKKFKIYHDTELWDIIPQVNRILDAAGAGVRFEDVSPENTDYMEYELQEFE